MLWGFVKVGKGKKGRQGGQASGEIWVQGVEADKKAKEDRKCMGLSFQVADVRKPLIAVKRITEKGNHVMFGPNPEDNYIENKKTGDKMQLHSNGKGSYIMEVMFVGGARTAIVVDSGAEENVCPWDWGKELFGTKDPNQWMNFRNANGGPIEHFGTRDVKVTSPF